MWLGRYPRGGLHSMFLRSSQSSSREGCAKWKGPLLGALGCYCGRRSDKQPGPSLIAFGGWAVPNLVLHVIKCSWEGSVRCTGSTRVVDCAVLSPHRFSVQLESKTGSSAGLCLA